MAGVIISGEQDPNRSSKGEPDARRSDQQDRRDFSNYLRREREVESQRNRERLAQTRQRNEENRQRDRDRRQQEAVSRRETADRVREERAQEGRRARAEAAAERARRQQAAQEHSEAIRLNRLHDQRAAQERARENQQRQIARRMAAEEDATRTAQNPNTYLRGHIGALRSRAAGVLSSRDFGALKQIDVDIKQVNNTLKERLGRGSISRGEYARAQNDIASAQAAVQAARASARPGRGGTIGRIAGQFMLARNSSSTLGSMLAGEGVGAGPWGMALSAGLSLAGAAVTAPQTIATQYARWMGNSARSRMLSHGSLDLGIRNGMSDRFGDIRQVFHRRGQLSGWQAQYGVDDLQALQMVSNLGVPISSVGGVQSAARLLASVPYQTGLMGMSRDQATGILQQGHALGLSSATARVSGATASNSQGFNLRGGFNAQSDQAYLNRFGRIMRQATAEGLDASQVGSTMTSLLGMAATSGQGYTNPNASFRLASGLMASGDASMRSGSGILSFQAGINGATQGIGFGGDSTRNTIFHNYFARHGGVPTTMASLRRLGVQTTNLTTAQRQNLNDALTAFRNGNEASGLSLLQPFLQGENGAGILNRVGSDEARFMPSSMQPLFMRNFMGVGTSQYYDYQYARQYNSAHRTGVIDDRARALAARTGVGAQTLADLWSYETGNRSVRGGAGNRYYGVGQVGSEALNDLKKAYPREFGNASLQDLQKNPELGRTASALYLQMLTQRHHGDARGAVNQYLGMRDGGTYTAYQNAERDTLLADMGQRGSGDASGALRNTNASEAAAGNLATDASEQFHELAPIIASTAQSFTTLNSHINALVRTLSQATGRGLSNIGMQPPKVH